MNKDLLKAGKIVNTHSLKGEVKVYPYCDSAEFLGGFDRLYVGEESMKVTGFRTHKGTALIRFDGVDGIDAAKELVGKLVYIDKREITLEPGRYFIEDILGLRVTDIDTGEDYGEVTAVFPTGANDVFEVKGARGVLLIPKTEEVVRRISLERKEVLISPIEGLIE